MVWVLLTLVVEVIVVDVKVQTGKAPGGLGWSGHLWALGQLIAGGSTPDLETFDDDDLCDRPPPSPEASNSTHVWRVSV